MTTNKQKKEIKERLMGQFLELCDCACERLPPGNLTIVSDPDLDFPEERSSRIKMLVECNVCAHLCQFTHIECRAKH